MPQRYQYAEAKMQDAIKAVREGMSKRAAAKQYEVPRTTLNDKMLGKTPEERIIGKSPILTSEEEDSLVQ